MGLMEQTEQQDHQVQMELQGHKDNRVLREISVQQDLLEQTEQQDQQDQQVQMELQVHKDQLD